MFIGVNKISNESEYSTEIYIAFNFLLLEEFVFVINTDTEKKLFWEDAQEILHSSITPWDGLVVRVFAYHAEGMGSIPTWYSLS